MKRISKLLLTAITLTSLYSISYSQTAKTKTSQEEVYRNLTMHHITSFKDNNLEGVMSDYSNESAVITKDSTFTGEKAIRAYFAGLMTYFPKQKSDIVLDKLVIKGELVYIVWHAKTPRIDVQMGSDTFIIKSGKIYRQTFAGVMKFAN